MRKLFDSQNHASRNPLRCGQIEYDHVSCHIADGYYVHHSAGRDQFQYWQNRGQINNLWVRSGNFSVKCCIQNYQEPFWDLSCSHFRRYLVANLCNRCITYRVATSIPCHRCSLRGVLELWRLRGNVKCYLGRSISIEYTVIGWKMWGIGSGFVAEFV